MAFAEKLEIVQLNAANEVVSLIDLNDDENFLIKSGTFKVVAPVLQRVEAADQRRWGGSRQVGQTEENGVVSWEAGVAGETGQECLERVELLLAQLAGNPTTVFLLWQPPGATEPTLYGMRGVGQFEPVYDAAQFGGAQLFMVQVTIPVAPLAQGLPVQVLASADTALPAVFNIPDIPGDAPAKAEVTVEAGTEPNQDLLAGNADCEGIAVDATYIYYSNWATGYIGRAKLDGTEPNATWLKTGGEPRGIAVNASHIYWASGVTNNIGRATIAGGEINNAFITGGKTPYGIAVSSTEIYWTNYASVYLARATLAGGSVDQIWFECGKTEGELGGLAISGGTLYFPNPLKGYISKLEVEFSTVRDVIATGGSTPLGIAVEGDYVYWANQATNTIGRCLAGGAGVQQSWVSGADSPAGVAANASTVFWANEANSTIGSVGREQAPPIWALLGWTAEPSSGLATPPFGILDSSEAVPVSEWTYQTVEGARGGKALKGKSSLASAYWNVDPATMVPDSFSGELSVEVWARILIEGNSRNAHWIVSAQPQDGLGYGAGRFTDEWGSSGRQVIASPANDLVWRMTRLGTLHLLVNPLAPRVWRIWLEGTESESAGEWGVDYLLLVPSTQRACSPSGKPNNASYPVFIANVGATVKTIRHDLSALVAQPGKYGHPDHGLGGQLLELPPGNVSMLIKLSSGIPDAPPEEESPFSEQLSHEAVVSVTVTPRYFLTNS